MDPNRVIMGKRLLIVDDEPDILESLTDLLTVCKIDPASSFDEAKGLLERYDYDLVILDIMGVKGFELLEIGNRLNIPALMLTAHSLNEKSLMKSVRMGAAYFVPKEKIAEIATYVAEVLEATESSKNPWIKWFDRLGSFFDVIFTGPNWRENRKAFLEKLNKTPK